uniref:Uncharacterized protein n=1 Tax=viral metagenome TaxID=1070528 RepID=A0A6M3IYW6_9ZZZZ
MIYKVFTIASGTILEGAKVSDVTLSGGVKIQAIIIGEEGRGSWREIIPVQGLREDEKDIFFAKIGETQSGKKKLLAKSQADTDEKIICVFLTKIGFRGSNRHTGDRTPDWKEESGDFYPFSGEQLTEKPGVISQGAAGRMGSGQQLIALMPKNVVFRTCYGGRLYGAPSAHYYKWTGSELLHATWDERQILEW